VAVCCGPALPEAEPPQLNVIAGTGTPGPSLEERALDVGRAATEVAVEPNGRGAFALLGKQLVLMTRDDAVPALPPDDVGRVKALAAASGALYAATDRGLYRWTPSQTPAWTRFSLAGDGALNVQVDLLTGSVWVATPGALFRIEGDAVTSFNKPGAAPAK
jgi:hypothetical protein